MSSRTSCLAVVLFLGLGGKGAAAAPPLQVEPLQGAVVSGTVFTAGKDERGHVFAWMAPLGKDGPARKVECAASGGLPERWAIGHGGFWVATAHSPIFGPGTMYQAWEFVERLDLGELLKGRIKNIPDDEAGEDYRGFAPPHPAKQTRALGRFTEFRSELYYDNLPAGRYRLRQFLLTNVRGRAESAGGTGLVGGTRLSMSEEERSTPSWSLAVYAYEASWDRKGKDWKWGKWVKEESIEVGFKGPFRVLSRGEDYYFLTSSGKLYRAPKGAAGRPRRMLPVWAEPGRPVRAFVTDADAGRTFLFVGPPRAGGKPAFFELAEAAKLVEHDPAEARPGRAEEPLRGVQAYVNVLLAHNRLKAAPAGK